MLHESGIYDVSIVATNGKLSDHYNPATKTVALSHDVYYGQNVSATAVAAHECGHAIQNAQSYAPLKLRSTLAPLQNVSATILNTIFTLMFFGLFLLQGFEQIALPIIIGAYGVFTLVAFVTLPVKMMPAEEL